MLIESLILQYCMLAGEILASRIFSSKEKAIHRVLLCLREIGTDALASAFDSEQQGAGFSTLKRVLRAFHQMATSDSESCRKSIVVADELHTFLQEWKKKSGPNEDGSEMLTLIDFMISESAPGDVLWALVLWLSSNEIGPALFPRLDTLLRRGVHVSLRSELSGSLFRLKHARQAYTEGNRPLLSSQELVEVPRTTDGIWRQMSIGALSLDK
jgi:hypothetical protein